MKFSLGENVLGRRGRGLRLTDRIKRWDVKMNPKLMGDILERTKGIGLEKVSKYQADFQFLMDVARSLTSKYPDYYSRMHDIVSYLEKIWYYAQHSKGRGLVELSTGIYLAWRYRGFPSELLREGAKALGVQIPDDSEIASKLGFSTQPQVITRTKYYESELTITNNSGKELTDYTVLVEIPEDWEGWRYVRYDGSDIHILDETGNPLYCYPLFLGDTYKWGLNDLSRLGYLYVKVPELPNGSTITLKVRFGADNPYPEYQDPSKVFLFFDDFETWSGWVQYGYGQVSQSSTRRFNGKYSAHKTSTNDPNGAYKLLPNTVGRDIALEFFVNRPSSYSGGAVDRVGVLNSAGNGYGWAYDNGTARLGIDFRYHYHVNNTVLSSAPKYLDRWRTARLALLSSGTLKTYQRIGSGSWSVVTSGDNTYVEFDRVYIFGGYDYYVDVLLIRTYVEPEPVVTLSSVTEVEV